jgi:hypothetical protein
LGKSRSYRLSNSTQSLVWAASFFAKSILPNLALDSLADEPIWTEISFNLPNADL